MTTALRNRDTVSRFLDATHSGDFDAIDSMVDVDIRTHGFPCHSPQSREEYKQFFREFGAAFTNMNYQTLALVADDTHVAARFLVEVDHTGPYLGIAPTGRRVSFTGQAIYRLKDGLVAETWLQLDALAFLGRIGAIQQVA